MTLSSLLVELPGKHVLCVFCVGLISETIAMRRFIEANQANGIDL